jgi:large subunit ribosomal protein L19e
MDLKTQRRIASKIMKCGETRVRIEATKEVEDALTREDVRGLIKRGLIRKIQKKGTTRARAKKILEQKRKGRRRGTGKRKGKWGSRNPGKTEWIRKVRPLREMLRMLRDTKQLAVSDYRKVLLMVKGGAFRNRKHMMFYLKSKELLKKPEKTARPKAKKPAAKKAPKKQPAKKAAKPKAKKVKE